MSTWIISIDIHEAITIQSPNFFEIRQELDSPFLLAIFNKLLAAERGLYYILVDS